MISKESARRVAQILYPQLWQSSPVEAIAKAVEFLHDAAGGLDSNSQNDSHRETAVGVSDVVKQLADQIYARKMQINRVAKSLGVSSYTIRTWLENKYQPNETNMAKIRSFLQDINATPEILTPEP
jgi:predicted transcriptional regulator YheO